MPERDAKILKKLRKGDYQTRDMRADLSTGHATTETIYPNAVELQPVDQAAEQDGEGLDLLDADQLRALAKERGIEVHHRAGAEKVRAALREAAQ